MEPNNNIRKLWRTEVTENTVTIKREDGLYYQVIQPGSGLPPLIKEKGIPLPLDVAYVDTEGNDVSIPLETRRLYPDLPGDVDPPFDQIVGCTMKDERGIVHDRSISTLLEEGYDVELSDKGLLTLTLPNGVVEKWFLRVVEDPNTNRTVGLVGYFGRTPMDDGNPRAPEMTPRYVVMVTNQRYRPWYW